MVLREKSCASDRGVGYQCTNCEYIVPIYSVCTCRNMELIINNEKGICYGENRFWYASRNGTEPKRKVYALTPQKGVSSGDDGTQYTC